MEYTEQLKGLGLSEDQSVMYQTLIAKGSLTASALRKEAGLSIARPLIYRALDRLVDLGLVTKHDAPKQVARFSAEHPSKLHFLVERQFAQAQRAKELLDGSLARIISTFNTMSGQPGVRILEGASGISELYEDILNERQPILLIRSPLDDTRPELNALVSEQLAAQVRLGITVRALTPLEPKTAETVMRFDAERLVERRIIPKGQFEVPAQILIYANKVALTAYDGILMTTIIENPAIVSTFRLMFEYMWNAATPEHERIIATFGTSSR